MDNLELRQKQELTKITEARELLNYYLLTGLITQKDIYNILKKDCNYIFSKSLNFKDQIIKEIISSPFILCDQDRLDLNIKKILPMILKIRSGMEIDELEMMNELGMISDEELKTELQMIKYNYYLSSSEGCQILKNGHVKSVKSNVLRK